MVVFSTLDDYTVFDWLTTITYNQRIDDSTFTGGYASAFGSAYSAPLVVNNVLHREEHKFAITQQVDFAQKNATWEIWYPEIPFQPKRGDGFIDEEGNHWVVNEVDLCDKIQRYRLRCQEVNQGVI